MPNQIVELRAEEGQALYVWFEPWAEGLTFPPNSIVELHASSEVEGELEIEQDSESTTVYGWPGSTLQVIVDGGILAEFDLPVPDALTRDKVELLFGAAPKPTEAERSAHRKIWWKFWH